MTDPWPSASVGEYIEYLGPGLLAGPCPRWPPDVFALTAAALKRSGAYLRVLDLLPRGRARLLRDGWPKRARRVGSQWRRLVNESLRKGSGSGSEPFLDTRLPREIEEWWSDLRRGAGVHLSQVVARDDLARTLLQLCTVADEASVGIGLGADDRDLFLDYADAQVLVKQRRVSLCLEIDPEKVRVLPKQHTPQRGITIRSLTHHLALCPASEVGATWHSPLAVKVKDDLEVMNLLLLPWPLRLNAREFRAGRAADRLPAVADPYRFFAFRRTTPDPAEFLCYLQQAFEVALEHVDHLDGVVLPELALTYAEYEQAERFALEKRVVLLAGVAMQQGDEVDLEAPANVCIVQPAGVTLSEELLERIRDPDLPEARSSAGQEVDTADLRGLSSFIRKALRIQQRKHHRWCLDRNQILQYGLGGMLPASKDCWELTDLGPRSVNFVTLGSWMTLSVLICEDLARQDPVADVLRAVGPNLVVALLMDGPQLRNRWPSRYASVLADDPGCSVLTLTSLGMASRSQPREGEKARNRAIALWRDVHYGEREIELGEGHEAGVLSLVSKSLEEFTADGRGDAQSAHFPVFAGFHSFAVTARAGSAAGRSALHSTPLGGG